MIKWNRPGYFIPPTLEEDARFWYSQARAQEIEIEIIESAQSGDCRTGEDLEREQTSSGEVESNH